MTRVGLVLGAGGVVGQAYHAGVLAALERDLGWDARTADVIVGSSAGSVTAALLRLGVPPHDLAAWAVGAPLSFESRPMAQWLDGERPTFAPVSVRDYLRPWRLPSRDLVTRTLRRPWAFRPQVAALTLVPAGRVDMLPHAQPLDTASGGGWPAATWVCAVRRSDGARVVFGRPGAPSASLAHAVAASCAIPGYFRPVPIDGMQYIDGGVHSPTNADVLRDRHLDVVIVVSPMSAAGGRARAADAPMRYSAHRRLDREIKRLQANGMTVVRFEPGPAALRAMGLNAMADDRSQRVVRESFLEAGERARTARVSATLAPLATRAAWVEPAA